MSLKITISGVRGIWGQSLTPELVARFGLAFGGFIGSGKILIGGDSRSSGPEIKQILGKCLTSQQLEVIDVGLVPTPSLQVLVSELKAQGAIAITASHNPQEWNGLKFISAQGIFLVQEELDRVVNFYHGISSYELKAIEKIEPKIIPGAPELERHLNKIIKLLDPDLIKKAKLKVVIDTCCAAGAQVTPKLLNLLGVQFWQINGSQKLADCRRGLEPLAENLSELSAKIKESGADIGFAQDPDADRLAIVNEKGEPIGEDYTLCLISDYLLQLQSSGRMTGQKAICTNLSTTRIIDDVAKKYQAKVIRTKIGEINVSKAMQASGAVVGGEGNGGIMIPKIGFGRDSLAGIAFMLQYLAESKLTVSQLVAKNPSYKMYKTKIDLRSAEQVANVIKQVNDNYPLEKKDEQDGVKIIFKDGNWLHVRASNTEPIIRIITEAEDLNKAKLLADTLIKKLKT